MSFLVRAILGGRTTNGSSSVGVLGGDDEDEEEEDDDDGGDTGEKACGEGIPSKKAWRRVVCQRGEGVDNGEGGVYT